MLRNKLPAAGVFQYSKETQQLVKTLLTESRLTIPQRKAIQECLKNGEPLPLFNERETGRSREEPSCFGVVKNYAVPRRRSKSAIIKSGAYEKEKFRSTEPRVDKEKEKSKLQGLMAYGKDMPQDTKEKVKRKEPVPMNPPSSDDWFEELMLGVMDRLEFLEDMKMLGQEKKYKQIIEQQVSFNLRQMKKLDNSRYDSFCKSIERFNVVKYTDNICKESQ